MPVVNRSLIVIGIISADHKINQRNAQRSTWLSKGFFQYRFLLDRETPELRDENKRYGDIYFLNATHSGYATAYGEKIHLWAGFSELVRI